MDWVAELSDLAYEAAFIPQKWKEFLDRGAAGVRARGGTLASVDGISRTSIVSDSLNDAWHAIITSDWASKNPHPRQALAMRQAGFLHDLELVPIEARAGLTWFSDFAPKWNLGPSVGTVLKVPNGGWLVVSFERPTSSPHYTRAHAEKLNPLRPSLARAVSLSSQLAFQQFHTTTTLLNGLGLPGAVVSERGRLLSANPLFEELIPSTFQDRSAGLHLRLRTADALLQDTLSRLRPELWIGAVASIPVPRGLDGEPPAIIHVLPIRGLAQDILFGATGLVLVDRLTQRATPSDMILRALYDLTPAEARVAATLLQARGQHKLVAQSLGVSYETVKTHSKAIYQKTGLSGVVELAGVLGGVLPAESVHGHKD